MPKEPGPRRLHHSKSGPTTSGGTENCVPSSHALHASHTVVQVCVSSPNSLQCRAGRVMWSWVESLEWENSNGLLYRGEVQSEFLKSPRAAQPNDRARVSMWSPAVSIEFVMAIAARATSTARIDPPCHGLMISERISTPHWISLVNRLFPSGGKYPPSWEKKSAATREPSKMRCPCFANSRPRSHLGSTPDTPQSSPNHRTVKTDASSVEPHFSDMRLSLVFAFPFTGRT